MADYDKTPAYAVAGAVGLLGTKPVIDLPQPVTPTAVNRTTVAGALDVLPDIRDIAKTWGKFESNQLLKSWEKLLPGFTGLRDQMSGLASSYMKGEIPPDVLKSIQDAIAAASAGRGTSGGSFQMFDTARSFNQLSTELVGRGTNIYGNLANMFMPYAPLRGVAMGEIAPLTPLNAGQTGQLMQWNEQRRWNAQMMENVKDAMPSPASTALANAWGQIDADIQDFFKSMYGGKMGGGGMGGGMGGGGSSGGGMSTQAPSYLRYYDSMGDMTRQTWNR